MADRAREADPNRIWTAAADEDCGGGATGTARTTNPGPRMDLVGRRPRQAEGTNRAQVELERPEHLGIGVPSAKGKP